jgi:hypothetical protein
MRSSWLELATGLALSTSLILALGCESKSSEDDETSTGFDGSGEVTTASTSS